MFFFAFAVPFFHSHSLASPPKEQIQEQNRKDVIIAEGSVEENMTRKLAAHGLLRNVLQIRVCVCVAYLSDGISEGGFL